jgi:hypothetical protein
VGLRVGMGACGEEKNLAPAGNRTRTVQHIGYPVAIPAEEPVILFINKSIWYISFIYLIRISFSKILVVEGGVQTSDFPPSYAGADVSAKCPR